MLRFSNFLLLFSFWLTINSFADVVFEIEQEEKNSSEIEKTIGSVKGNKINMDFINKSSKPESSMIYDGNKNQMIAISHFDKTYFVIDEETMNQIASQMDQAMAQMEAAMKDMSPKEREMMKQMMKGRMPQMQESNYVEPVLKKVGSDNVNGYACTKYDVYKGVEKARQHCVTKWSNIEGGDEIYDVMLEMSDFINKMTKAYSKGPFGSQVQFERSLFNQLKKLNGFPVHTIDYDNGSVEYVSSFVSSKKVSVDSAKFNPPTGYKKQTMDTR